MDVTMWRLHRRAFGVGMEGNGGLFAAGRWHKQGSRVVYLGSTASIVVLELLVHIDIELIPADLVLTRLVGNISVADPEDSVDIQDIDQTQECGDHFLGKGLACALRVPSVIVPEEFNYMVNALHPQTTKLSVLESRTFSFDPRLI